LLRHVENDYVFAVLDGDGAHQPPWQSAWDQFLSKWILDLTGESYEPDRKDSAFAAQMTRHKKWLVLEGEASFTQNVTQSVQDFILCQCSRDTFAPSKLGQKIRDFSQDLRAVVGPFADSRDMLTYQVKTTIEWGKIRQT